jgi:glycosyltransferase involved in cell wall biosynthesis
VPRLIHVEHDGWHYASWRRRWLGCAIITALNPRLVAISPEVAGELRRLSFRSTPTVITNGVDTARFAPRSRSQARERLGLAPHTYVIGSTGRLEYEKGHDVLIEAFARLPHDPLLVIAGTGTRRDALEALAQSRGVSGRVRFLGHRDDVPEIYPAFDVFCLPSRKEGLPFAVLEAQATGIPAVASDVGSVSAAVCPRSGEVVAPQDPGALAAALERQRQRQCRVSPRPFIAANYDWPITVTKYAHLIES